jgi:5-methylcytosine-specific restriction endonuclease McrA
MYPFRDKTPKRRENAKERENYRSHKNDLKEDFNRRCGYCDDTDFFSIRSFAIDHFVPKIPKDFTHDIKPNFYYNLVYACNFCNGAKSNKWITKDAAIHNNGEKGFIEPTSENYTDIFKRNKDGSIVCNGVNTDLSQYIIEELKLWYPVHRITWKLEKLNTLEERISNEIEQLNDLSLKSELEAMQNEIRGILLGLFRQLFAENE